MSYQIWHEGYKARQKGLNWTKCRFNRGHKYYQLWQDGWDQAHKESGYEPPPVIKLYLFGDQLDYRYEWHWDKINLYGNVLALASEINLRNRWFSPPHLFMANAPTPKVNNDRVIKTWFYGHECNLFLFVETHKIFADGLILLSSDERNLELEQWKRALPVGSEAL